MSKKTRSPFSTIQEFRGIVHMMPYGSLDGPAGHMWMLFYRCATCFELDITMSNIEGTPFATKLAPYMVEPTTLEDHQKYLRALTGQKALIIDHIFSTLDELAPQHAREWNTLEDLLSTPKYRLSLQRPETGDGDAVARVDSGPLASPALDLLPTRFNAPSLRIDPDFLTTIPQIPASSITFPEAIDSNTVPSNVITPTFSETSTVTFIPAGRTIHNMDIDRITNPSHFAINTYLELHRHHLHTKDLCVQDLLAVVTTETPPPETEQDKYDATGVDQSAKPELESGSSAAAAAAAYPYSSAQTQKAIYLAGILLMPLPAGARPLSDPSVISLVVANPWLRQKWHAALLATVQAMRSCDPPLYHGCIHPSVILVCTAGSGEGEDTSVETGLEDSGIFGRLYLTDFTNNHNSLRFIPHVDTWTPQGDLAALENIFGDDGWLMLEVKKTAGELEKDYEWKRKGLEADQETAQKLKEARRESERAKKQKAT